MHDALTPDGLQEQRAIVVDCVVWYLAYRNKSALTTKHRPCRGRQTGSTGMPARRARVRLGLASEPREDSVDCRFRPEVALPTPTRHPSPHPSLKPGYEASIMDASERGGASLHPSSRMHLVPPTLTLHRDTHTINNHRWPTACPVVSRLSTRPSHSVNDIHHQSLAPRLVTRDLIQGVYQRALYLGLTRHRPPCRASSTCSIADYCLSSNPLSILRHAPTGKVVTPHISLP